jgi:hypothetical protein
MSKIILIFLAVFGMFYFGIDAFRKMTGREKWNLTKTVFYSILCAVLTTITLSIFVIVF